MSLVMSPYEAGHACGVPVRLDLTERARLALRAFEREAGPLVLQHGIGCHGRATLAAYPRRNFRRGPFDILLGTVEGLPVYVDPPQAAWLTGHALTIDLAPDDEGDGVLPLACHRHD